MSTENMGSTPNQFTRSSRDSIGWARWTWNFVTGCLHDCPYCYARNLAKRFNHYPKGFEPDIHVSKLRAPELTPLPSSPESREKRVFVSSMGDLFGEWVPRLWIDTVFAWAIANPLWEYVFLTKNPRRYLELESWPKKCWVGTTVDSQERVQAAEEVFSKLDVPFKFLSCEPLLGPLQFTSLSVFDMVMIGGTSTGGKKVQPEIAWTRSLIEQCQRAGVSIYLKDNLDVARLWGSVDMPINDPAGVIPSEDIQTYETSAESAEFPAGSSTVIQTKKTSETFVPIPELLKVEDEPHSTVSSREELHDVLWAMGEDETPSETDESEGTVGKSLVPDSGGGLSQSDRDILRLALSK